MTSQIPDPNDPGQAGGAGNLGGAQPDGAQPADEQPKYAQPQQPQQPPHGQYIPPTGGAQQDPVNNVQLNYWLSVFFIFIPALIFYFIDKGKSQQVDQFHRENLNFSLIRTGVWLITVILMGIPILGWLIWIAGMLAQLLLFIFHIMAAAKVKENFEAGREPGFMFNFPIIK